MDLVVKGRGDRVPDRTRARLERKLDRLSRLDPTLARLEVELTKEPSPRVKGGHRVDASLRAARATFRATATGTDPESALDLVMTRLERQIMGDHGRRRSRMLDGAHRVKSGRMARAQGEGDGSGTPEQEVG
jgi:ribosomal subunit interface protein